MSTEDYSPCPVWRSTNGGLNWNQADTGLPTTFAGNSFCVRDSFIFSGNYYGVYRSSNEGAFWLPANFGLTNAGGIGDLGVIDTLLVAVPAGAAGVYMSSDDGLNWQFKGLSGKILSRLAISGNAIFVGAETVVRSGMYGSIYRSTDLGISWTAVNTGLTDSSIRSLTAIGSTILAGTTGSMVFRSTNAGASWEPLSGGLTVQSGAIVSSSDTIMFVASLAGIYLSTNYGDTWINTNYPAGSWIYDVGLFNGYIFAPGPTGGIWMCSLASVLAVNDRFSSMPSSYLLGDNYPNPFNPSTSISYRIPHRTHVLLRIYNLLGQLVTTLVDDEKQPGGYSVSWEASDRPSGVYFYRIEAGKFTETKKMLLIR